ncbi:NAD-dependent DNA ligase LigA [Candidatus Wolfebacteria bacterium]|nr:NAD-dependent DNA ligase LigA [Candidatus Wolfebacteria bacterium]
MIKEQARERIEKLKKVINEHRYNRLVLNKETISPDAEDALKKELFDLEQEFPDLITPDSPTQRVGGVPLQEFKKVRHESPMLSLSDVFSRQDIVDWLTRAENYLKERINPDFYANLKMDGLAIELIYESGVFVQGSTRGDGVVGEDVTNNLKTIESIPLRLEEPRTITVRGEVFLMKKEFDRLNKELEKLGRPKYANPRNLATGTVRQLNPRVTAHRRLHFYAYDILHPEEYKTHAEVRQALTKLGFAINKHGEILNSTEEVSRYHQRWEKEREKLPYEVDGVFLTLNNNELYARLGVIGKAPRGAVAYKFSPREATTIVEGIKVQVGRTGTLTPVALLRPVEVGGVRIRHATLHNFDQIERLGLKIGDTVVVTRAGDVIPYIGTVIPELRTGKEKKFTVPTRCPIDGSAILHEGAIYRCSNSNCGARNRENLRHFVSRQAFDIRGLGPKILDRFMDEGLISDAGDIFELKEGDIATLERFGEKSAGNIIREISGKKTVPLPRFINALGILHVGEETAFVLAQEISKSEFLISKPKQIFTVLQKTSLEKLQQIPDVGPKVAQSIYDWFHDERNIKFLEKLDKAGIRIESERLKIKDQRFKGKTFVLTGGLETMTRDEAKEKIRALGGDVSEAVSKKTDYVVAGSDPGSKHAKAQRLGVEVLGEKEFLELMK